MQGIPPIPIDGSQYSGPFAGVPSVLEYDAPTGGYKLVVVNETGVALNISGTVEVTGGELTLVGGAQYGEDIPHVSGQTGTFTLGVRQDALASPVSADGDYSPFLLDFLGRLKTSSYVTGTVDIGNWQFGAQYQEDAMFVGGSTGTMVLAVRTDTMQSYVNADGDFATLNVDAMGRLYTWTTGSYTFADTELSAAVALGDALANPTAGGVGSYGLWFDTVGGNWERDAAVIYQENLGIPVAPRRLAFAAHYDYALGQAQPTYGGRPDGDAVSGGVGGGGLEHGLNVRAVLYGRSSTAAFDRMIGTKERGLNVSMISGSFPGQAAAIEINDAVAGTQRAGLVGALGMMYDTVGGNWERDPAILPADSLSGVVMPQRASFNVMYNYSAATYARMRGFLPSADGVAMSADTQFGPALSTASLLFAVNQAGTTADRMRGNKENGLNVTMISGSWPASGGNPLTDAYANPTVPNFGAFGMIYDVVGGDWDRDPARLLAENMALGVFPQRISNNMYFDYTTSFMRIMRGGDITSDSLAANTNFANAINVRSAVYGFNGAAGLDRIRGSRERGLAVSMISGSFPGQAAAIEINDAVAGVQRAGLVGSLGLMYDVAGGNWERDPARLPNDGLAAAVSPLRTTFGMHWNYTAAAWRRLRGGHPTDAEGVAADTAFSDALNTKAAVYGFNGSTMDRIRGSKETGLNTSMISGSFPDGAEALPADAATPRKALQTTSYMMGYNGVTYDRIYMGQSGSMAVDLISQLDPVNDEVTAYITGTTSLNLGGKTIVRALINISGSASGETELIAAVASEKIKVLEAMIIGNADVSIFFQSGFTGTALTGPMSLPSDGDGFFVGTPAQIEAHHFETVAGENLVIDHDANVLLGGWINYYTEA